MCEGGLRKILYFQVNVGLRQKYSMSPWLFNIFINGVVRQMTARIKKQRARVVYGSKRKWEVSQVLFADDTILEVDSRERLQNIY